MAVAVVYDPGMLGIFRLASSQIGRGFINPRRGGDCRPWGARTPTPQVTVSHGPLLYPHTPLTSSDVNGIICLNGIRRRHPPIPFLPLPDPFPLAT